MQPSASKTHLLLNCQYPFDPSLDLPTDGGGLPARYGSAFHVVIALLPFSSKTKPENYGKIVDSACKKWDLKSLAPELAGHVWGSFVVLRKWLTGKNPWGVDFTKNDLKVEKSYAINPSGPSREVHLDLATHEYEGLLPHELGGTADIIGLKGTPFVEDHKTGHFEDFSSPEENDQLKTLALVPWQETGTPPIVAVLHADRRGLPMIHPGEMQAGVLSLHKDKLRKALARIGDGYLRPGPWCNHCRAKSICPTQYAQVVPQALAIVEASGGLVEKLEDSITTAEKVGRFHQLKGQMKRLMDLADEEVRVFVEAHPDVTVIRPDGKHLEFVPREVERLSKKSVLDALGKKDGERMLTKLRELNCIPKATEMHLHALDDK